MIAGRLHLKTLLGRDLPDETPEVQIPDLEIGAEGLHQATGLHTGGSRIRIISPRSPGTGARQPDRVGSRTGARHRSPSPRNRTLATWTDPGALYAEVTLSEGTGSSRVAHAVATGRPRNGSDVTRDCCDDKVLVLDSRPESGGSAMFEPVTAAAPGFAAETAGALRRAAGIRPLRAAVAAGETGEPGAASRACRLVDPRMEG